MPTMKKGAQKVHPFVQKCVHYQATHQWQWLVFHVARCPFWLKLEEALIRHNQTYISVCVDDKEEFNAMETLAIRNSLESMTGLCTTPCVYRHGGYVGDSQKALECLEREAGHSSIPAAAA